MARRKAQPQYETYDDELDQDADEDSLVGAADADGAEGEYVSCPVCNGRGRGCRYCDGFGDVHPDDVEPILEAYRKDRGLPVGILAIVGCLILGAAAAVFMVVWSQQRPDGGEINPAGAEGEQAPTAQEVPLKPKFEGDRSQEIADVIISMRISMKAKDYRAVIQEGEANLHKAKDPNQRRSIELMIDQARKKL